MDHRLTEIYFIVWGVCAVGSPALLYGRSAAFRQKWLPRVAMFNVVAIGGLLLVLALQNGDLRHNVVFIAIPLAVLVLVATRMRVCPGCGAISQPQNLWTVPLFCRKCGAKLDASDGGAPPVR
jgi:hypothetical protein